MATSRRKIFERDSPVHPLTDYKLGFLAHIAHLGLCTASQLSRFLDLSEKSVRDHLADLFNHGLLDRTALAVVSGTSPLIYTLSRKGARHQGVQYAAAPAPLFLPHELEIRDFRVWLERLRLAYGHEALSLWRTGTAAYVGKVRPDALFVYPLRGARLTGMVEIDRGTEKSPKRWEEKFEMYARMMQDGELQKAIGQDRGRILVITPDARRRDAIATILSGMLRSARIEPNRFWVTQRSTLEGVDLLVPVWRVPEAGELRALVPDGVL